MADNKDDAGAGIWEPVRPAATPYEQAAVKPAPVPAPAPTRTPVPPQSPIPAYVPTPAPVVTPAIAEEVDPRMRSLFVAPTDSAPAHQEPRSVSPEPAAMYSSVPTPAPAADSLPNVPRQPAIQYPAGQPGPAGGHFAAALPTQTYEPSLPASQAVVAAAHFPDTRGSTAPAPSAQVPSPQVPSPQVASPQVASPPVARPQVARPQVVRPQVVRPPVPPSRPSVNHVPSLPPNAKAKPASGRPDAPLSMSAQDLSSALLLKPVKPAPVGGWRKALYTLSGRSLNLGNGAKDQQALELINQINQPLQGCYKVAVLSLKGGVGKTTTTVTVGSAFSSVRGDRVIAIDANPDRGTLSQKVPLETPATVRNLLRDEATIEKYSDVRGYTSQSRHRLEVLASDSDPAVSEAFSGEDYIRTVNMLEKFYSIVLTDCGTGLMHSAMAAVLEEADSLIVVSSGSVDGARSASATLDWLDAHGHSALVTNAVAVINAVRPGSGKVDLPRVVEHFEQRCRAVRLIPFDPHLEEGAEVDLDRLRPATRDALFVLAATVAEDFPRSTYGLAPQR